MGELYLLTEKERADVKELAIALLEIDHVDKYVLKRNIMHILKEEVYLSSNQARWWYMTAQLNKLEAPDSLTRLILE